MGRLKNMRREAFCQAYAGAAWGNAAEAYRNAGYKAKNAQVAASGGERLLRMVEISARVKELRDEVETVLGIDRRAALEILARVAKGRLADFILEDGALNLNAIRGSGQELQEYVEEPVGLIGGTRRKIKLRDPVAAIERLARMMGWEAAEEVNVNHGGTVAVEHRWTVDSLKGDNGSPAGQ